MIGPSKVSGYFLKESRMQATIITTIGDEVLRCWVMMIKMLMMIDDDDDVNDDDDCGVPC